MSREQRRFKEAVQTLISLEGGGYAARLAGGCVRDRLMDHAPDDYDVATTARPEQVIRHFQATGRRTVPTGLDHGTVTLLMPAGPIEITTLRIDVATDGRHAQVAFGDSFEEDAARRDFTINAMFEDARGTVYDYGGGQADLASGVLRFVGDAGLRIREDYLRILRLFRFWARFGFQPAAGTLAAVAQEKDGLARISQERLTTELLKLCAGRHAREPLMAMADTGVLPLVLPELRALASRGWPAADVLSRWRGGQAPHPHSGLAVLGGLVLSAGLAEVDAAALGLRLKLSTADQRRLAFFPAALVRLEQAAMGLTDAAARLDLVDGAEAAGGEGAFTDFFEPVLATIGTPAEQAALAAVARTEVAHGSRRRAKLPVDGHAAAAQLGIAPGPALGPILADLKRAYRNGAWSTRDEGLLWLTQRAASRVDGPS